MRKHIKQLKKQVLAVLLMVMAMSFFTPTTILVYGQATQNWQTAYAEFLRDSSNFIMPAHIEERDWAGEWFRRYYEFALWDLTGDGIPEMLVLSEGPDMATGSEAQVYTFDGTSVILLDTIALLRDGPNANVSDDPNFPGLFNTNNNRGSIGHFYTELVNGQAYSVLFFHTYIGYESSHNTMYDYTLYRMWVQSRPLKTHTIDPANIATHILGITANPNNPNPNSNPHPFAIELQNIINNHLSTWHTLRATLINLDQHGEQQGVVIITRCNESEHGETTATVIYMVGDNVRTYEIGMAWDWGFGLHLLDNDMVVATFMGGGGGPSIMVRLHNRELQSKKISDDNMGYLHFSDWASINADMRDWEIVHISSDRGEELRREFGLFGNWWEDTNNWWGTAHWWEYTLPDHRAQILAMQATTAMPTQPTPTTTPTGHTNLRLQIGSTTYTLNGQSRQMEAAPFLAQGRTMIPIRIVAEALGADVGWIESTRTVTIQQGTTNLSLVLDIPLADGMGTPVSVDGRTFVPVAFVVEQLGASVSWDEATRTVIITIQ